MHVNTPDFDPNDWLINPDLSAVDGVDKAWWVVDGDTVREATAAEKDANISAYRAEIENSGMGQVESFLGPDDMAFLTYYNEVDENGNHDAGVQTYLQPYMNWRSSLFADLKVMLADVEAATTVAAIDTIRTSFLATMATFAVSRPAVTKMGALNAATWSAS